MREPASLPRDLGGPVVAPRVDADPDATGFRGSGASSDEKGRTGGFDWRGYLRLNEDLVAAGIAGEEAAREHWLASGRAEGRTDRVPAGFDWHAYLKINDELVVAGVDSAEAAWKHWDRWGRREGRATRVPADFDWWTYLALHPELRAAGIDSAQKAYKHWLDSGRREGRETEVPADFDWVSYLTLNPDLREIGVDSKAAAWSHWLRAGHEERRPVAPEPAAVAAVPADFDWLAYLALNEDLPATGVDSRVAAWEHWRDAGRREGRLAGIPPDFDWQAYLELNPDLRRAGVGDRFAAYLHWVKVGRAEGRPTHADRFAALRHTLRSGGLSPALEPLRLAVSSREPRRVNLLIERLDDLFGGYIATFALARQLRGWGLRVRLVVFMPEAEWRDHHLAELRALETFGSGEAIELEDCRDRARPLAVHPDDRFVARSAWGAHLAEEAARRLGDAPFVFLMQEYEPLFHGHDSLHAMTLAAYRLRCRPLVSTELLLEYLEASPAACDGRLGLGDPLVFRNPVLAGAPPDAATLARRETRGLLVYLRPRVGRNLPELTVLAVAAAVEAGIFDSRWRLAAIGNADRPSSLPLPRGLELEVLPRAPLADYHRLLAGFDVGLSLMLSPHPSLVPLDMAAAGLLTVTNRFANKTPERLAAISTNLVVAEPTLPSVVAALGEAAGRVGDAEARVRGARLEWPRSWDEAFDERARAVLVGWLGG